MRRSLAVGAFALVLVMPAAAGAGIRAEMQASPAPATTEDDVVISNVGNDDSTCQGGVVRLFVEDEAGEVEYFDDYVVPDASGNWSQSLGMLPAGDYLVEGDCESEIQISSIGPAAQPFFQYPDLVFTVVQAEPSTTSTSTTTTTAAPTTTATAAATAAPRFTG